MASKAMGILIACLLLSAAFSAGAAQNAPWGTGNVVEIEYKEPKVVYDVAVDNEKALNGVLDRASYLSNITGANPLTTSIVLVLHGPEVEFFAVKNYAKYKALMQRAQSLTVGEVIKIRMCQVAAQARGLRPADIHGFVELIPMGDAEIVRLQQQEGHAYMR